MRTVREGDVLDAAVVGAGVGGCYCAYRLVTGTGPGPAVALFEQTDRVGGRLWSDRPREAPGLVADLGAMRLHRGLGPVLALVRHLGLDDDLAPFSFGRPENLRHRHGATARQGDTRPDPDDLVVEAAERLVPGFTELRRLCHEAGARGDRRRADSLLVAFRERRDRARLAGRPLGGLTWPHALDFALGAPAVAFLHDTGGYDVRGSGESAAARLDLLFRTPPDAEYVTLRHGMQGLADALHAGFAAAAGVTRTGRRLVRLDREPGADHYRLTFAVHVGGRPTGDHAHAFARSVVLALPPEALRRLDPDGLPVARGLGPALEAVEPVPAVKLFLVYERPWWRDLGLTRGRSTSDTALRQLWYGGTCPPPTTTGPALLLVYPSGRSAGAWTSPPGGAPHPAAGTAPPAGDEAVDRAHALVTRMHGTPGVARPLGSCRADWSAAWHVRRPGPDPGDTGALARRPVPGERVHVVGDCWTPDPGSIEGALASADDTLRRCFGLPDPPWDQDGG